MKTFLLYCLIGSFLTLTKGQVECHPEDNMDLNIRLNQGSLFGEGSGLVEICVCSGAVHSSCYWQTVSAGSTAQPMSWMNSVVVCRELNYFNVQSPILQSTVPETSQPDRSVEIYPTTFICDGTESFLRDCATGFSTSILPHNADAYVSCVIESSIENTIRLTGSTVENMGVVEYYMISEWRTICPNSWTDFEANLACTSLGYVSGTATDPYSISEFQGSNINEPTITSVSCTGATYFSACTTTFSVSGCSGFTGAAAGVVCQSSTDTEGSVRLFDTTNSYDRVEVLFNGRWGTVCDTAWDSNDADVTCRELGRDVSQTSVPTFSVAFNSLSSRPIWIQGYSCNGDEFSLSMCSRPQGPVGYVVFSECSHSNDAGVTCADPPSTSSNGLSGGAIAGIVIGPLVTIIIVVWVLGGSQRAKRRRAANARCRTRAVPVAAAAVQLNADQQITTTTLTPQQTRPEPEPKHESIPATSQLAQVPPPSYNEALVHTGVKEAPQYPDEEKKVPYPVTNNDSDPAYPSAPPGPNDYQGYPPPTQQPAGYMPPPPNAPYPVDPYPQSAYPPPPGTAAAATAPLPYPT